MLQRALAALALLAVGARAEPCPPGCACADSEGEREYACQGFTLRGKRDDFASIVCHDDSVSCATMPYFPLSNNGTLTSVGMTRCPLPERVSCLLARLGASDVRHLVLNGAKGQLTAAHVAGLAMVTMLRIDHGSITDIPYDVLAALPSLRDFRIRETKLQLPPAPAGASAGPFPPLKFVELSSDSIGGLPPGALSWFAAVPELHLWDNSIENVTEESFRGLAALDTLDLSRNPISMLPARVFAHTPRLRDLTLAATTIAHIEEGALTALPHLEKVVIKFGQATLKFDSRALADLPSLTHLTILHTPLAALPADLLTTAYSKLQDITITDCGLQELPADLFKGLGALKTLDLGGNALTQLTTDIFRPLVALEQLNLNDNRIEELPENLLSGLKQLLSLSADSNRLARIHRSALQGAAGLRAVSLANNQLTLEPEPEQTGDYQVISHVSPFSSLLRLERLGLRANRLRAVPSDWRYTLVAALRHLDLRGNRFTELDRADVQFLSGNVTVDLRHNQIATIELFSPPAQWPDDGARAATDSVMLLDDNPFRCDCHLYSFVQRLQGIKAVIAEARLDVGQAVCVSPPLLKNKPVKNVTTDQLTCALRDEHCPDNCICDLRTASETIELDCDKEPLIYPSPMEFGLRNTRLRLRSVQNTLAELPAHIAFLNLSGVGLNEEPKLPETVREVDLSNNSLVHPPSLLASNVTISLSGNPFLCDCAHAEDVETLQRNVRKILDYKRVICNGNESPWLVDAARLCDFRRAAFLGGALAVLGLVAVILAVLTYKYSLEIRVFLFSRGWCLQLCPPEKELDQNLLYDAFVSFSQKDARWVAEELVPRLESSPHHMRLCVHYRDWLVGDMIPAQIARSVEQSRRTIVVLSKNFLESSWAALEFRAAHLRSQRERRARVLVVVLEEMPPECEMDAELRAYLSTNTYLKWGDPWFWKKLVYALAHTRPVAVAEDRIKMGGLAGRLTADGLIVNDAAKVVDTQPRF